MNTPINRFLSSIAKALALHAGALIAAAAAWLLYGSKAWVADTFLIARFRRPGLIDALTGDLINTLGMVVGAPIILSTLASVTWIVMGCHRRIDGPGQAASFLVLWGSILAVGQTLTIAAVSYIIFFHDEVIALELRWSIAAIASAEFLVCYYLLGTLFPTPPILRPAVPAASLLTR